MLNHVCIVHLSSSLPSSPWFSWPISICLHQSYQLTLGLDSSMPATRGPPYIRPSIPPFFPTSLCLQHAVLSSYMHTKWSPTLTAILGFTASSLGSTMLMYIKRVHTALFFHWILFVRNTTAGKLIAIRWRTVILTSLGLMKSFLSVVLCCLYLSWEGWKRGPIPS